MTNRPNCKRGYMLVAVLIVAAVGLLFGAGALLTYRFQTERRIERQHELEKLYAVRSALNLLRLHQGRISTDGLPLRYYTESERSIEVTLKPVETIFPRTDVNGSHFSIEKNVLDIKTENSANGVFGFYSTLYDYECGADVSGEETGVSNSYSPFKTMNRKDSAYQRYNSIDFNDVTATNRNSRWWINIGMNGTGGWLDESFGCGAYGRRYYFKQVDHVGNVNDSKDVMRLCLIRDVQNPTEGTPGRQHGWPLSMAGEMALVLEIRPLSGACESTNNAEMLVYEYECLSDGGETRSTELTSLHMYDCQSLCNAGIQLADDKISIFYIDSNGLTRDGNDHSQHGYIFSGCTNISKKIFKYFADKQELKGVTYPGTNKVDGVLKAPDIRAVIEVQATSETRRKSDEIAKLNNTDSVTGFKVTPAYQYDVELKCNWRGEIASTTERATVAQKTGRFKNVWDASQGENYSIITYDAHGTANKGFRTDERRLEKEMRMRSGEDAGK